MLETVRIEVTQPNLDPFVQACLFAVSDAVRHYQGDLRWILFYPENTQKATRVSVIAEGVG